MLIVIACSRMSTLGHHGMPHFPVQRAVYAARYKSSDEGTMASSQWYHRTLDGRGNTWAETGRLVRPTDGGVDGAARKGWGGRDSAEGTGKSQIPEGRDWENVGQGDSGQVTVSLKCQAEEIWTKWVTRIWKPSAIFFRSPEKRMLRDKQWKLVKWKW